MQLGIHVQRLDEFLFSELEQCCGFQMELITRSALFVKLYEGSAPFAFSKEWSAVAASWRGHKAQPFAFRVASIRLAIDHCASSARRSSPERELAIVVLDPIRGTFCSFDEREEICLYFSSSSRARLSLHDVNNESFSCLSKLPDILGSTVRLELFVSSIQVLVLLHSFSLYIITNKEQPFSV